MASTYLTRTQGTPTNSKKWTISFWMKGKLTNGNFYAIFGCDYDNGDSYFGIGSGGIGRNEIGLLEYHTGATIYGQGYTDASLRDSSGWYHIVFSYDSTQATASDRGKTYINGVFNNSTYATNIPLNHDSKFNTSGVGIRVGNRSAGGGSANYDGCLSHFHFIDGTDYDATAFGQYDANGVWTIKTSPSVTYGTNGFFILKDGNSVTDQSGNSNNFTVGGGTLTNTEDNPSNVFATLNPLSTKATLSEGNTVSAHDGSATGYLNSITTIGMVSGKYYCECKITAGGSAYPGIGIGSTDASIVQNKFSDSYLGETSDTYGYYMSGTLYNNGSGTSGLTTFSTNDIVGMALDLDSTQNTLKYYKNGSLVYTVNIPDNSSGWFFGSVHTNTQTSARAKFNFGNGYFGSTQISSAGTNASGNGIFEYDVPTGYTALSTKGLNL